MRSIVRSTIGQFVLAVLASVMGALLVSAFSHLSWLQGIALGLGILCVAEGVVIVLLDRRTRLAVPGHPGGRDRTLFSDAMWTHGWKTVNDAIGDVEYEGVLWRPKVPAAEGGSAERVGVGYPPRCPVCQTGLIENTSGDRDYEWRCPTGDFSKRVKESMRGAIEGAELIAQNKWEQYRQEQARKRP